MQKVILIQRRVEALAIIALVIFSGGAAYYLGISVQGAFHGTSDQKPELRIFIASSLINVARNVSKGFEVEHNCRITFNSGGSDQLTTQIRYGSPCDVFMAADSKWTKQLEGERLLLHDQYWNFTTNEMVVATPADNPANITSLADLTKAGVKIIVAGWEVPLGSYTNNTLNKISTTWGNPALPSYKGSGYQDFRDKVITNVISYETTAANVVGKIKLGIGDAGFVYATDVVFQGNALNYVRIPSDVNTVGTYGIAIVSESAQVELAAQYVLYWLSDRGQIVLREFGFGRGVE